MISDRHLDSAAYDAILAGEKAAAVFTDPPYNVKIKGHVSGKGKTNHREFPMAAGETTEVEFTDFQSSCISLWRENRLKYFQISRQEASSSLPPPPETLIETN